MTSDASEHPTAQSLVRATATAITAGVAVGLLFATAIANFTDAESTTWRSVAGQQAVYWGTWGLLVVPLWMVLSNDESESPRYRWTRPLAGIAGAWLVHAALCFFSAAAMSHRPVSALGYVGYALRTWYIDCIVLAGIVSAMMALRQRRQAQADARRASTLALQLARAQLRSLESQLHPHFLFNALHSIAMLARANDGERIVQLTAGLGDLLRAMLDAGDESETTLRDELALVSRYLDIERIRFAGRLETRVDVPDDLLEARLPRFILQPLVENAMRHGLEPKMTPGLLCVGAARTGDVVTLTVADDGVGAPHAVLEGEGPRAGAVGLRITRDRLAGLYGARASFRIEQRTGGGTVATIVVPWHTAGAASELPALVGAAAT